jgi:hypothetical protein
MGILRNGTTITRVQYNGTYYRNVVRNGSTVFSLSDWNFVFGFASNTVSTYYNYGGNYTNPGQVPLGALSSWLNSNFPVQIYGAGTVIMVEVYATVYGQAWYFVRNEYYEIYQNA